MPAVPRVRQLFSFRRRWFSSNSSQESKADLFQIVLALHSVGRLPRLLNSGQEQIAMIAITTKSSISVKPRTVRTFDGPRANAR